MDDWFGAIATPTLKHDRVLEHHWLDLLGKCAGALTWLEELSCQVLEDDIGRDSLGQQLVKLRANLAQVLGALLSHDVSRDLSNEALIVGSRDLRVGMQVRRLKLQGLQHHYGPSDIAAGVVRDRRCNLRW